MINGSKACLLVVGLSVVLLICSVNIVDIYGWPATTGMSGKIVVSEAPPHPRPSHPRVYKYDLPTFYGTGSVRSSSEASNFFLNFYSSSFDVRSGGNVTTLLLPVSPVSCFLDSVSSSLYFGKYGKFGPFRQGGSSFWVIFSKSSVSGLPYNLTFVHDGSSHHVGVFFASPFLVAVQAGRRSGDAFLAGLSILVVTLSSILGFIAVRWKLRLVRT